MLTLASSHPAKVEAQDHRAGPPQRSRNAVDNLVVQGSAEQRMRVADQRREFRVLIFRLLEQRFEPPRRTWDVVRLDSPRQRLGPP
jgi:hypothetical protein